MNFTKGNPSMPKKKERNSDEYFRGQIREKDKLIKSLQRRVRELERKQHIYDEAVDDLIDIVSQEDQAKCDKCKEGHLTEVDLKHITIIKCNTCDFKKTKKA